MLAAPRMCQPRWACCLRFSHSVCARSHVNGKTGTPHTAPRGWGGQNTRPHRALSSFVVSCALPAGGPIQPRLPLPCPLFLPPSSARAQMHVHRASTLILSALNSELMDDATLAESRVTAGAVINARPPQPVVGVSERVLGEGSGTGRGGGKKTDKQVSTDRIHARGQLADLCCMTWLSATFPPSPFPPSGSAPR